MLPTRLGLSILGSGVELNGQGPLSQNDRGVESLGKVLETEI